MPPWTFSSASSAPLGTDGAPRKLRGQWGSLDGNYGTVRLPGYQLNTNRSFLSIYLYLDNSRFFMLNLESNVCSKRISCQILPGYIHVCYLNTARYSIWQTSGKWKATKTKALKTLPSRVYAAPLPPECSWKPDSRDLEETLRESVNMFVELDLDTLEGGVSLHSRILRYFNLLCNCIIRQILLFQFTIIYF